MPKVTKAELEEVLDQAVERLKERIRRRKGKCYVNRHEALGKITEEYLELNDAIRSEKRKGINSETLDVAEACLYFAASELAKKKARQKRAKKSAKNTKNQ